MGKKTRNRTRDKDFASFDDFDEFDDLYDEDFDLDEFSRDIYSTEWGSSYEPEGHRGSTRRKARHKGMKRTYSELDEWEEFGGANWQEY